MIPPEQLIPLLLIWLGGYAVILALFAVWHFAVARHLLNGKTEAGFLIGLALDILATALTAAALWWWTVQAASYGQ